MTISVRILNQIVLVILFGRVEVLERSQFYCERLPQSNLYRVKDRLNGRDILTIYIVNTCTISRTAIVTLAI